MLDNPNALRDGALTVAGLYAAVAVAGLTANHWLPSLEKRLPPPFAPPLIPALKR
ncbi:MAG: hypothetical protein HC824_06885 [Synechococcales cyanobacterium RM1_1_8]|nr:hypothetical protein [Synechococcales cyanobacterium RM1_1_8]